MEVHVTRHCRVFQGGGVRQHLLRHRLDTVFSVYKQKMLRSLEPFTKVPPAVLLGGSTVHGVSVQNLLSCFMKNKPMGFYLESSQSSAELQQEL